MRSLIVVFALALASCAHPYRISRGDLGRLIHRREPFVLVFGSLTASKDTPGTPTLRFSHAASKLGPEFPLRSLEITHGGQFYAVLQPPKSTLAYLDEMYVEVGTESANFDKIVYLRLKQIDGPQAMYLGEITMNIVREGNVLGHMLNVNVRDDFASATVNLKREYPRYSGPIAKGLAVRTAPNSPPPPRLH